MQHVPNFLHKLGVVNIGDTLWLNAYWYEMYAFGKMPYEYGNNCKTVNNKKRCTALVSYEWNPDPPAGNEEEFCGTFGIYSRWKTEGGKGTKIFQNGLQAIKCSNRTAKSFTARNICVKELKGACNIQNQIVTDASTDTTTNTKTTATTTPTTTMATKTAATTTTTATTITTATTDNITVGEKCGDGWTPHSVGETVVSKEDLLNGVNLEEIVCLKKFGLSTSKDDLCYKNGARRLYFTTTHETPMIN